MASLRDGIYYTRMRVPPRFRHVDDRKEIWVSLGTSDKRDAELEEIKTRAALVADWEARAGIGGTPEEQFRRAATIAASRGFTYRTAPELAAEQLDEILTRVEAVPAGANPQEIAAILGGVEKPRTMLSGLVDYVASLDVVDTANRRKNPDQARKWINPRKRAVANLRAALKAAGRGDDMPVDEIDHAIAALHFNWWAARLKAGKHAPGTPKKDYDNMSGLLKAFWLSVSGQNPRPYSGRTHADRYDEDSTKPEFKVEWIAKTIITPGALDGLNPEARDITIISAETGCRQSEIYNTPREDWHTEAPIPHFMVQIVEGGEHRREIKNKHSKRMVPLVGAALEAARRNPNGFPRYIGTSGYSDAVNKFFRENELFPSANHTIGGLRHSWESRMIAVGIDNEHRGMMMGHSRKKIRGRVVYGDEIEIQVRWTIAMLVAIHPSGAGSLVEGDDRKKLASSLRKLMDEAKEAAE